MFQLRTTRLILQPHALDNAAKLHEWFNDPHLTYFDGEEQETLQPEPLEKTQAYLKRILQLQPDADIIHYAIHKRADEHLIGYGQIAHIDRYNRLCLLGITIGEKQEWGRGYAREALSAVIEYCFAALQLNRIAAAVYGFHHRSIQLFEGLGFCREGTLRQNVLKQGEFADEHLCSMLRAEWDAEGQRQEPDG
jgi:RimJ/RimL family protein N-acetyltransferase